MKMGWKIIEIKVRITSEIFQKFEKVRENGGGLESYNDAGLSLGEITVIASGYDFLKKLNELGMLDENEITANFNDDCGKNGMNQNDNLSEI